MPSIFTHWPICTCFDWLTKELLKIFICLFLNQACSPQFMRWCYLYSSSSGSDTHCISASFASTRKMENSITSFSPAEQRAAEVSSMGEFCCSHVLSLLIAYWSHIYLYIHQHIIYKHSNNSHKIIRGRTVRQLGSPTTVCRRSIAHLLRQQQSGSSACPLDPTWLQLHQPHWQSQHAPSGNEDTTSDLMSAVRTARAMGA